MTSLYALGGALLPLLPTAASIALPDVVRTVDADLWQPLRDALTTHIAALPATDQRELVHALGDVWTAWMQSANCAAFAGGSDGSASAGVGGAGDGASDTEDSIANRMRALFTGITSSAGKAVEAISNQTRDTGVVANETISELVQRWNAAAASQPHALGLLVCLIALRAHTLWAGRTDTPAAQHASDADNDADVHEDAAQAVKDAASPAPSVTWPADARQAMVVALARVARDVFPLLGAVTTFVETHVDTLAPLLAPAVGRLWERVRTVYVRPMVDAGRDPLLVGTLSTVKQLGRHAGVQYAIARMQDTPRMTTYPYMSDIIGVVREVTLTNRVHTLRCANLAVMADNGTYNVTAPLLALARRVLALDVDDASSFGMVQYQKMALDAVANCWMAALAADGVGDDADEDNPDTDVVNRLAAEACDGAEMPDDARAVAQAAQSACMLPPEIVKSLATACAMQPPHVEDDNWNWQLSVEEWRASVHAAWWQAVACARESARDDDDDDDDKEQQEASPPLRVLRNLRLQLIGAAVAPLDGRVIQRVLMRVAGPLVMKLMQQQSGLPAAASSADGEAGGGGAPPPPEEADAATIAAATAVADDDGSPATLLAQVFAAVQLMKPLMGDAAQVAKYESMVRVFVQTLVTEVREGMQAVPSATLEQAATDVNAMRLTVGSVYMQAMVQAAQKSGILKLMGMDEAMSSDAAAAAMAADTPADAIAAAVRQHESGHVAAATAHTSLSSVSGSGFDPSDFDE